MILKIKYLKVIILPTRINGIYNERKFKLENKNRSIVFIFNKIEIISRLELNESLNKKHCNSYNAKKCTNDFQS
jgi:hypothetical protein